jgi:hypothetical protein
MSAHRSGGVTRSIAILALSILPRSKASPEPLPMPKVVSSAIKTPLGVDTLAGVRMVM